MEAVHPIAVVDAKEGPSRLEEDLVAVGGSLAEEGSKPAAVLRDGLADIADAAACYRQIQYPF